MQKRFGFSSALALAGAMGLLAATAPAHAQLTNGSFENPHTSNFSNTGWTLSAQGTTNGSAIVTSADNKTAKDGTYFAYISAGTGNGSQNYSTLTQTFNATAGQTLSGWAYFQAAGTSSNNDDALVEILQGNQILFQSSISAVGNNGATPWTQFNWDVLNTGSYTLVAEVRNQHSNGDASSLGLDGLSLGGFGTNASPVTPEGSSLFMLIAGGLPFAVVPVLRRKRK